MERGKIILGGLRNRVGELCIVKNRIRELSLSLISGILSSPKIRAYLRWVIWADLRCRYNGMMEVSLRLRLKRKMRHKTGTKRFICLSDFTEECLLFSDLFVCYSRGDLQIYIGIDSILLVSGRESSFVAFQHGYTHLWVDVAATESE